MQILCIVEHIVCLILEDVAGYVKRKDGQDADKQTEDEQKAMETT